MKGTRVLVMGLGVHGGGLGVVRWLLRQGACVTVTDMASAERLSVPLAALEQTMREEAVAADRVQYVLGAHRADDFVSHDMLVVNPAVRPDSPWVAMAQRAGVPIETQMTLFFRACRGRILGVTGTKGKTTTALLAAAMLRQHYPDTVVAGNMRVSALDMLDQLQPETPVVLELSSFQLVGLGQAGLSPRYACITNFSPDHLNYHDTMEEYARAKRQIFWHQESPSVVVLNHAEVDFWLAGRGYGGSEGAHSAVVTFSTAGDSGADCVPTRDGGVVCYGERLFDIADIRLPGEHNLANVLAATALVHSFGLERSALVAGVRGFGGVEHRLEVVRELDGVRYVNDTTATNPAAALAALSSFDAPLVFIAGGADKGLEFGALPRRIVERVRVLVLLDGSATPRLEREVREVLAQGGGGCLQAIVGPFDDFGAAIAAAREEAAAGDVVLLSPGCASFGMFRNEFHRGDEFRRIVQSELL
jgi:UDP-N-acetylmuramoylalanine--D-glutamate ligase